MFQWEEKVNRVYYLRFLIRDSKVQEGIKIQVINRKKEDTDQYLFFKFQKIVSCFSLIYFKNKL